MGLVGRIARGLGRAFGVRDTQDPQGLKIDLVTQHPETGVFALILVETGPWPPGAKDAELRRIQDRLHACLDAALHGAVADMLPASRAVTFEYNPRAIDPASGQPIG